MKKTFLLLLISYPIASLVSQTEQLLYENLAADMALEQNKRTQLSNCPGIPVVCQFQTNKWAEFELLPMLRNINKTINTWLSKLKNIQQRTSPAKFKDDIHENAEQLVKTLEAPTIYEESLKILKNNPKSMVEVTKIIKAIQEIINAYDYIGQHGIENVAPLNKALKKNGPILEKAEKDIETSRKANFEIIAATKKPDCTELLIDPKSLCIEYAAHTQPVWIDLEDTLLVRSTKGLPRLEQYEEFIKQRDLPDQIAFNNAVQKPSAEEFELAISAES